jgi:hypothetical protein
LLDEQYREELDIERLQTGSDRVADLPRYEVMALVARGKAVAGNAGKFALVDRNPLNLNFPLWMAFAMLAFEAEQSRAEQRAGKEPVQWLPRTLRPRHCRGDAGTALVPMPGLC